MCFAIMTEDTVQHLKGQVPALALSFYLFKEPHALDIMEKVSEAVTFGKRGQECLPIMTERGVADIMTEGYGLDQVFVEPEKTPDGTRYLGYKLHMKYTMGYMVIFDKIKYLGFIDIPGIGQGMQNPVSVKGEILSMSRKNMFFLFLP